MKNPDFTAHSLTSDGRIDGTGKPIHNAQPYQVDSQSASKGNELKSNVESHTHSLNASKTTHQSAKAVSEGVSNPTIMQQYSQSTGDSKGFFAQGSGKSGMGATRAGG